MNEKNRQTKYIIDIFCSCFTIGIFAPLEIFFMNSSKIWFDIYDMLFAVAVYFVFICIVAFIVLLFFVLIKKPKVADVYTYLFASIVFILYFIGSFAPVHISLVDDGESVNWLDPKYNAIQIIIILLISVILILLYHNKKRQMIVSGSVIFVFGVQIYTLFTISLINPGDGWKHRDEMILSEKNFQTYSKDLNMEILVLDEFDARVMTELLAQNSDYAKCLDGFTFYPDTVSMYNFSDCSVAQMLTGTAFTHQSEFDEYLNKEYASSYLINRLRGEYSLNIYDDITLLSSDMVDDLFDNYVKVNMKVSSKRTLMKYMYRLVGCKYMPFYLRKFCWFATDDLDQLKTVDDVDGAESFEDMDITASPCNPANTTFYYSIDDIKLVDEKMFHWHHLRGLHGPRTHDANMMEAKDADITECARGVMLMLDKWINSLKEQGIYDNHVIIILADHGTQLDSVESFRSANSLLMIKGYNEHHNLAVSDKKVTYDELDSIYEKLLDGNSSDESVTGIGEGDIRHFYRGLDGYYEDGDLIEYVVPGNAADVMNIQETGVIYR